MSGTIVGQVVKDLQLRTFAADMIEHARRAYPQPDDEPANALRGQEAELVAQMERYLVLASSLQDPAPALEKVDELQMARRALQQEIRDCEAEFTAARALARLTDGQIERVLRQTGRQVRDYHGERLKDLLQQLISKVEIDPTSGACRIEYAIGIDPDNMGEVVGGGPDLAGFEPMVIGHQKRVASPRERGCNPAETDPMSIGQRN